MLPSMLWSTSVSQSWPLSFWRTREAKADWCRTSFYRSVRLQNWGRICGTLRYMCLLHLYWHSGRDIPCECEPSNMKHKYAIATAQVGHLPRKSHTYIWFIWEDLSEKKKRWVCMFGRWRVIFTTMPSHLQAHILWTSSDIYYSRCYFTCKYYEWIYPLQNYLWLQN